jgi:uncharacterized RDD family membrane protein YckC
LEKKMQDEELEYVGFWPRVWASIVDTVIILCATLPVLVVIYGWAYFEDDSMVHGPADALISWGLPAVAVILFWLKKQATPGKMMVSARVVDAVTGKTMTPGQSIGRYLGYFVSALPLGLGLLWVAWDPKKQGWHDKLAGTVVVRARKRAPGAPHVQG